MKAKENKNQDVMPQANVAETQKGVESHKIAEMHFVKEKQHNCEAVNQQDIGNHDTAWENILIAEWHHLLAETFYRQYLRLCPSKIYSL
jgi:hypothetical protein